MEGRPFPVPLALLSVFSFLFLKHKGGAGRPLILAVVVRQRAPYTEHHKLRGGLQCGACVPHQTTSLARAQPVMPFDPRPLTPSSIKLGARTLVC